MSSDTFDVFTTLILDLAESGGYDSDRALFSLQKSARKLLGKY